MDVPLIDFCVEIFLNLFTNLLYIFRVMLNMLKVLRDIDLMITSGQVILNPFFGGKL